MEGKRMVRYKILTRLWQSLMFACTTFCLCGCNGMPDNQDISATVSVIFEPSRLTHKSIDPEEDMISDMNLLVFDEYGRLEENIWVVADGKRQCDLTLTTGKPYRFVACINFGYKVEVADSHELDNLRYHIAYPDEYKDGIPMYADTGYIIVRNGQEVFMKLIRLMSKISIRINRNYLSEGVEMSITGIRIGNCPRYITVFSESHVKGSDDCFPLGFSKTGEQCSALNRIESYGLSYPISLYMLENIQGKFSDTPLQEDSDKVFDPYDPRKEICSYIELDIDYISPDKASTNGQLKYRFYLGENRNDLSVERNCHYRITVCPEDDGLSDDGWRVDKDAITSTGPITFSYYPDSYIRGNIGDKIHLGCSFTPKDAPFDVGLEYMENDKRDGIYDYVLDEDGHGAMLTLTGPGSGLIYMSAGPPVNEAALWYIEVNQPENKWSDSTTYLDR